MQLFSVLVVGSLLLVSPARSQSPATDDAAAETELRAITQSLLDAVAPGDTAVWSEYLHPRLVHMDENGKIRSRAELLEVLKPLPAGLTGRIEIDTFGVQVHGAAAVAAYDVQEYLDYHGQPLRSRFRAVDTWLKTDDGWRMIGAHTGAVLKPPPVVMLNPEALREYEGVYALTPDIHVRLRSDGDALVASREGRPDAHYRAEARDIFFVPEQPRTRRIFLRDASGRVDSFVDRREGEDVRWLRVQSGD